MATTAAHKVESPKKILTQPQPHQNPSDLNPMARVEDHHSPDTENNTSPSALPEPPSSGDESKAATITAAVNSSIDGPVSDTQKKIHRAERFGMPVKLSEEEKRNSRAERFGTASVLHGSDALKKSEEQKRKTRAERFGLVQSVPADEEVKKKARLARFTPVSKTDSLEEDKKKARATRFSQPPSSSLSQVDVKGNIEVKTAIAGKDGGGA